MKPHDVLLLLDTGADASTLPFSLAKKFCADPASELVARTGKGIGGAFRSHMLAKPPAILARLQTGTLVDEFDLPEVDSSREMNRPGSSAVTRSSEISSYA